MFNYRANPHGIRPMGGSNYFRTPPGQRSQRQSFNRPISPATKPLNKPMGSRPPKSSPLSTVKQGEKSQFQDTEASRPSVEQVSPSGKEEDKGSNDTQTSPTVVQQTTNQSPVKQDDTESADTTPIPQRRSSSPSHPAPPEPPSANTVLQQSGPSNEPVIPKSKEEEMSWSPPPPETTQKPLTIPLTGVAGDSSQGTDTPSKVPFGATPSHNASYSGRSEPEESAPANLSDPPFQSQVMKGQGHQYKKPTQYRYDRKEQTTPHKSEPSQVVSPNTQQTPQQQTQQGYGNIPANRRKPGGPPGRWGKSDRPTRRSEPNPSPMETEYEMDPKVDRSILDAEPKEHFSKFTNRCRLFVGGILNADEKLLKEMFIKFGEISELWLNKEKGFGFVKMDTKSNAQRAIDHYNGMERQSSMVRVRFAAKNSSVKVSNLTHAVTNELLEEAFKIFGEVEHAVVACDERGRSLGWGIVDFAMKKAAIHAIFRCKEGMFILCKSPIPVMVTELKEEDLEEGVVEKTMHKNILYQREREDGPRFAMPGSMDYQIGQKWKRFLENARSEREMLEERLKAERIQLENETEGEVIHFLEEQDNLRHQEELRRQDDLRKIEETKRQDYQRQQEMIKQENRRRSQSMRMQEELKRREESLLREGDYQPLSEDRSFNRPYSTQNPQSEVSFGYSQDYEHGYSNDKNQDWQFSPSYKKDWGGESAQGYGGSAYQTQGRSTHSGYDEYPGYTSQYDQRHQGGQQYGDDSYNKERSSSQAQYGSGDQYKSDNRYAGGSLYAGYSSGAGQSSGDSYRNYGSTAQSGVSTDYQSDTGYGAGYGSSSQAAQISTDRSWTSQRQNQGGYEGMYQQGGAESGGTGGSYDRRRPYIEDWQSGRMDSSYSGVEKRRKI